MRISSAAFMIASLFAATAVSGQGNPAVPAMNVLIANDSANDTQAAVNDKFAELLTKYSNGRFKASARHGGALGNNAQMLAALQAGAVHGMATPAGLTAAIVPENSMFDMPFLLPGVPALITAFAAQSKAAAKMMEAAEAKGIHVIGYYGIGPRNFLTRFPVAKLADLQGKKIRVIPSPAVIGTYQDWGVVPRPMEFGELYTALQQGTIDGLANPPDITYRMKWHEAAKYYTITEHFAFAAVMMVSKKWFDALSKDLQGVVTKAGKDTIAFANVAYTKSQEDSLAAMRRAITVTNMPPAEIQKMKDLALKGVWERMKTDPQKGPLVKLLLEDVANFKQK